MAEITSQPTLLKQDTKNKKTGSSFQSILNGLLISLMEVPVWLGLMTLVFTGSLSVYLGQATLFLMMGTLISFPIISYFSSWKGVIGLVQDVPAAILIVISAEIIGAMSLGAASSSEAFITIVATIGISSITTGIILYLLGAFRLGNLVRYLPFPVIAGFLGGTGWLLLSGGILSSLPEGASATLFQLETLVYWVPCVLLGILFYWSGERFSTPALLPALMVLFTVAFHLGMRAFGQTLPDLINGGWLLTINAVDQSAENAISFADLQKINWLAIAQQGGTIFVLAIASAIAMLLNSSGFELKVNSDLDPNQDLRVTGIANILSGLVGGWVVYMSPVYSSINAKDKKQLPLSGLLLPLFAGAMLLFGMQLLSLVPRFVIGAVIAYVGIGFLMDWVVAPAKRLSKTAYGILLFIIATVIFLGLMEGVAAGLMMAVVLFVYNSSRVKVIRHHFSGLTQRSRVTRSAEHWQYLEAVGSKTRILQLQGYMFFGTANRLLEEVRELIDQEEIRYLILDFRRVSGIDSTALISIAKIEQVLSQNNTALILTALKAYDAKKLGDELDLNGSGTYLIYKTVDEALQYSENAQLQANGLDSDSPFPSLIHQLEAILPEVDSISTMLSLMEKRTFKSGSYLIQQGDSANERFFIDEGMVTAQVEREDGSVVRLETMGSGRVVGELGFYLGQERTASVVSESESAVYVLTKQRLAEIEQKHPAISSTLHQLIIHLLSDRVTHLVRVVDVLQI